MANREVVRMMKLGFRRFWSWLKSKSTPVIMRAKNDAEELRLRVRVSRWRDVQERKHVNVWIQAGSTIAIIVVAVLAVFLVFPMFGGMVKIVFQEADPNTVPSVSQEGLTGLIFVSAALGAFIVWFTRDSDKSGKRMLTYIGKLFLFAALAFSLFMLLSPLLPEITSETDPYSNFLRYATAISFIAGGVAFAMADVFGLVYLWRF
jgi:hypothetical protein